MIFVGKGQGLVFVLGGDFSNRPAGLGVVYGKFIVYWRVQGAGMLPG